MRGKQSRKRQRKPDHKYNSTLVTGFINVIMLHGKKTTAEKLFYSALESASKSAKLDDLEFLNEVVDKVRPNLEVKSRRVGGANYQVPVPVTSARQETLAIRWIVGAARNMSGSSFDELLKRVMLDTFKGEGDAMKKKADMERMAEANKAFAHFRW